MNQLHNALSPYLLQHADNPVHWREWGDAAFAEARARDVPVLLSVGYAACHWCHVMAHESFECPDTAALMNANFVNVKVDREERPDIDRIYQAAHFVFAKRAGGWPLTMFLSPEVGADGGAQGEPFFGGTYFPKTARHGLPAFTDVLRRASLAWQERRSEVRAQNAQVGAFLRSLDSYAAGAGDMTAAPIAAAHARLRTYFDDENGGLGEAPKFPHAVELLFCLQTGDDALRQKALFALQKMAAGGLHDMLGGGFFRYCVDAVWQVPHFEKMLYDNALLLPAYAEAVARFDDDDCLRAAEGIVGWLQADMTAAEGAFFAAMDADSSDGEGAFYLWEEAELRALLTAAEYAALASHCGLAAAGAPRIDGKLHLLRRQTVAQTAAATSMAADDCAAALASAKDKLRRARAGRVAPAVDDKILTAWNALMCEGLARAGRVLRRPEWRVLARRNFDALAASMRPNSRVLAARRGGQHGGAGFLDDVANWLAAALELLRGEFCPSVLAMAQSLAGELCDYYEDAAAGGFFLTAHDGEKLICRPKPIDDSATPCGNGVAARALLHLYALTGEARWQAAGERALRVFYDAVSKQPAASTSYLLALDFYLRPPALVFLAGDADECRQWQVELEEEEAHALVYVLPPDVSALPAVLQKRAGAAGEPLAYWCDASGCRVIKRQRA